MCVRWKLALLGLLSDEQGRLQGGECLIQMMNIDVCHTIRANWQAIHRESNLNAYKTDSYNVCRMYATFLKRISTSFEHIDPYSSILLLSYVDGGVILCGGRSRTVLHGDCLRFLLLGFCSFFTCSYSLRFLWFNVFLWCLFRYDLNTETWTNHSVMLRVISDFPLKKRKICLQNRLTIEKRFLRTTR